MLKNLKWKPCDGGTIVVTELDEWSYTRDYIKDDRPLAVEFFSRVHRALSAQEDSVFLESSGKLVFTEHGLVVYGSYYSWDSPVPNLLNLFKEMSLILWGVQNRHTLPENVRADHEFRSAIRFPTEDTVEFVDLGSSFSLVDFSISKIAREFFTAIVKTYHEHSNLYLYPNETLCTGYIEKVGNLDLYIYRPSICCPEWEIMSPKKFRYKRDCLIFENARALFKDLKRVVEGPQVIAPEPVAQLPSSPSPVTSTVVASPFPQLPKKS